MIKVFYTDRMLANASSFSPSAGKPKHVVASWQALGLPIEIVEPEAVSREDLYAAHNRDYVDGVLDLRRDNGFGNRLPEVAASLPYTSGAMSAAAREAIANGEVAVAPCSGFHHADFDGGGGFCTFNGLMVTALALKRAGLARRVGILDLDQHYGNGTVDIINNLGIEWIDHFTRERSLAGRLRPLNFPSFFPSSCVEWITATSSSTKPEPTRTSKTRLAAGLHQLNYATATDWFSKLRGSTGYQSHGISPVATRNRSAKCSISMTRR